MRRRPVVIAGAVVLAGLVGAGLWLWLSSRSSTPVSEQRALSTYRARAGTGALEAGAPRPGVYTYAATGSERGGLGPVHLGRGLPAQARYIVSPAPGGFEAELDLSGEHIEAARFRLERRGLVETWTRTKITLVGIGADDRRSLRPAPLWMPRDPRPGQTWHSRYRAGDLAIATTSRAVGRATLRVDGREVPTVVVRIHTVTSGPHSGTRDETIWWAPSLALPVRHDIRMDIGGTVSFRSNASLALTSLSPRT
jgi:hypothetical protein